MRNAPDYLAAAGTLCVLVGLAFIWWPLAIVALGGIMWTSALVLVWARRRGPEEDS